MISLADSPSLSAIVHGFFSGKTASFSDLSALIFALDSHCNWLTADSNTIPLPECFAA
jgi:hypothetical protein